MALNFGKLNFSTSFNPTSAFPIDARSYFETLTAAQEAASKAEEAGSSNTTYYIGQILTVNEGGVVAAYQINGDKTLIKLAATTASGDLSADVAALQGKVSTLEGKVTALETAVGTEETGLVKDVADLKETTGTLSSTVGGLGTRLTTAEGEIDTLQGQIGGLTGAMHFKGVLEELPGTTADYEDGDVILVGGKEYVCAEDAWHELGDEGSHLTKTEAAATYVPITRTINGHALNANVTLSSADIEDLGTTISAAIGALDVASVSVGAGETIKSISETDGKIAVEKQSISITSAQVTDLTTTVDTAIDEKIEELDLANTYLGLHAAADKVANDLTIGGKTFNGSAAVTVTATDLGALTAIPQATAEALGGIKLGHAETATERAVVLDVEGKAYVSVPAAVAYSAGAGLSLSDNTFSIATGGVTVAMLAGGITDDKITSLDVQKLTQKEEDTLIIDGGTAE